ncbi:glycosyltransferase [Flammeovirgaceae bacterium 311]|nr:glycosyltransferase [Flammeovirgaceae bacterium 311]
MKNFLLISYYWPPSGGVGVQRWLKLTKYLPLEGWRPVVLTPENPAFDLQDSALEKEVSADVEVLRLPIWEPYHLARKFSGKTEGAMNYGVGMESGQNRFAGRIMHWLRGNVLLPDPRIFWLNPASKFAMDIMEKNEIEAIITTGPPHSMHLIGRSLKKKTALPWIADFRDPWSEWDVLRRMHTGKLAMRLHQKLEKAVLKEADLVISATPGLSQSLERLGGRPVHTLLNGLDLQALPQAFVQPKRPSKFRIFHAGMLNEGRNPEHLWPVLASLCEQHSAFADALEVVLVGSVSPLINPSERYPVLKDKLQIKPPVPNQQVWEMMQQSAVLLLLVDRVPAGRLVIPYKMYEYLAAQKPVLYIGFPDTTTGDILREQQAGESFTFDEEAALETYILKLFQEYQQGSSMQRTTDLTPYDRQQQARQVAQWLNELVPGTEVPRTEIPGSEGTGTEPGD